MLCCSCPPRAAAWCRCASVNLPACLVPVSSTGHLTVIINTEQTELHVTMNLFQVGNQSLCARNQGWWFQLVSV